MNHTHGFKARMFFKLVSDHLRIYRFSPGRIYQMNSSPATLCDITEPNAKITVPADKYSIARFDDIGAGRLHSTGTGRRYGHGHHVFRVKHLAQHLTYVVHDLEERWIEMPHNRESQCLQYSRVYATWSGPQQHLLGRLEFIHVSASQVSVPPVLMERFMVYRISPKRQPMLLRQGSRRYQ